LWAITKQPCLFVTSSVDLPRTISWTFYYIQQTILVSKSIWKYFDFGLFIHVELEDCTLVLNFYSSFKLLKVYNSSTRVLNYRSVIIQSVEAWRDKSGRMRYSSKWNKVLDMLSRKIWKKFCSNFPQAESFAHSSNPVTEARWIQVFWTQARSHTLITLSFISVTLRFKTINSNRSVNACFCSCITSIDTSAFYIFLNDWELKIFLKI
jgi:hypothetical protein